MDRTAPQRAHEWSEEDEKTGRLLNEEVSRQLEKTHEVRSTLDTKAGLVVAAGLTFAQFLAARKHLNPPLVVATFIALGTAILLAYNSLRIRQFREVPEPRIAYTNYKEARAAELLFYLATAKVIAFEHNRLVCQRKAMWQVGSYWALMIAALLGAAAQIVGE